MNRRLWLCSLALTVLLGAGLASAQQPGDLIDVYSVRVKPDKRTAFEAAMKKMAAANRKHGGDRWIAFYTMYGGEMGTYHFASPRANMAAMDTGMESFQKALAKGIGAANLEAFFAGYGATLFTESADLRMRRRDLSLNLPETAEGQLKMLGESRYMRTTIIRLHPGRLPEFSDMWKQMRAAMESGGVKYPFSVSVGVTGPVVMIYLTTYAKTLGDFDEQNFSLPKAVGDEAYRSFQDRITRMTAEGRTEIYRFSGELSSPPDELAAVAPDFWAPKPAAVKPK